MYSVWHSRSKPLPVQADDHTLQGVQNIPGLNRLNYGFFVGGMIFLQILIGYFWPIQFVRFSSPAPSEDVVTLYYVLNRRTVLDDALVTIGIVWVVIFVATMFFRGPAASTKEFPPRALSYIASHPYVWVVGLAVAVALYLVWLSSGVEILYLRASNVMIPILMAMEFFFLLQVIRFHPRPPHGILSAVFIAGGTCFWLGFLLGLVPTRSTSSTIS